MCETNILVVILSVKFLRVLDQNNLIEVSVVSAVDRGIGSWRYVRRWLASGVERRDGM